MIVIKQIPKNMYSVGEDMVDFVRLNVCVILNQREAIQTTCSKSGHYQKLNVTINAWKSKEKKQHEFGF